MKIIFTCNKKEEHNIEFIDKKYKAESITYKQLKEAMYCNNGVVVVCEDDDYFANVFPSSDGGYAIYWYESIDLEQFLKGNGEIELDTVDGAHCAGSMRDALEWAYIQE